MNCFALRAILRNEAGEGDGGGGDAPPAEAPEQAKAPKAEADDKPAKKQTTGDLKAKSLEERKRQATKETAAMIAKARDDKASAKAAERDAPKDEPDEKPEPKASAKSDEPSDKAEKAAKAIEKAGETAPDQKVNETDKQYEARLVKMAQDLRTSETQHKREKARAEAAEQKAAELEKERAAFEKRLARAKSPEERLEFMADEMGVTLEQLIQDINDGKTRPPGQRPRVDPEVQAKIEKQEAEIARLAKIAAEREAKEQADQQAARFTEHTNQASKWLKDNAAEFPLLQSIPWAARNIVQAAYQNGGDMSEPARRLQQSILEDFAPLLDHDDAWKLLDGKLSASAKEKLAKRFGVQGQKAPVVVVPEHTRKPPSKVSTEVATPERSTKDMSAEEKKRIATRKLERFLADKKSANG